MPNTTSFELSKQLFEVAKSKGVELPATNSLHIGESTEATKETHFKKQTSFYPKYTTDELLAWLPEIITTLNQKKENDEFGLSLFKLDDLFGATYENLYREPRFKVFENTPSNALAKLAIYLIENDLLN